MSPAVEGTQARSSRRTRPSDSSRHDALGAVDTCSHRDVTGIGQKMGCFHFREFSGILPQIRSRLQNWGELLANVTGSTLLRAKRLSMQLFNIIPPNYITLHVDRYGHHQVLKLSCRNPLIILIYLLFCLVYPFFYPCFYTVSQSFSEDKTPWPESASELYQPSDRRLSAKLVPTFADRRCHVVSVTDPYCRNLGFLVWSRHFFFQVAPQLYSRG
jgi:hypothetical protein